MNIKKTVILFLSAGMVFATAKAEPADTLDIRHHDLDAITVTTLAPRRVVKIDSLGFLNLNSRFLGEQVTLMGSGDPLAIIRALPSVTTTAELQGGVSVRGSSSGDNLFTSDNARVINPLHMLGLFSAYNPAYYRSYVFAPGRIPMTTGPLAAGYFAAESGAGPDSVLNGSVAAGLIESHAAVRIPVAHGLSIGLGGRCSYLDAVFPDILKLGGSRLKYGFTDINGDVTWAPSDRDILRLSFFGNRDYLDINNDVNGSKDGELGWRNSAASLSWLRGKAITSVSRSEYRNKFKIDEGGRRIDLPSDMCEYKAATSFPLGRFTVGADFSHRHTSGQNGFGEASAIEYSISGEYGFSFRRFRLTLGMRMAGYHSGAYRLFRPQPRIEISAELGKEYTVYVSAGRRVMFDRLIEESGAGLPTDFRVLAGHGVSPSDVYGIEAGVRGMLGNTGVYVNLEAYARRMRHAVEWNGSILDLASASYNPLDNILEGRGYAAGIEVSAMRQVGKVRGRLGYNYSTSRVRIEKLADRYIPSSHDRPHDLSVSLNYNPLSPLTLSGSFTYASGTPYTRAKYGYMIDENLICEYFEHNSSRLPAYRRLDLAAAWKITREGRLSHTFTVSVYNALGCRNVLFRFPEYSVKDGIRQRESVMQAVIPSLTYTLQF